MPTYLSIIPNDFQKFCAILRAYYFGLTEKTLKYQGKANIQNINVWHMDTQFTSLSSSGNNAIFYVVLPKPFRKFLQCVFKCASHKSEKL